MLYLETLQTVGNIKKLRQYFFRADVLLVEISRLFSKRIIRLKEWILRSPCHKLPVYLATPLNVISSIMVGSDRPFAFAENKIIRYELPASRLSMKNETGGFCKRQAIKYFINILS